MFTDTPGVTVQQFIPALSQQRVHPLLHLIWCVLTLAAIIFAPAYVNQMVDALGMWSLWTWMAIVFLSTLFAILLMPQPDNDTYIVTAESESALEPFTERFDIKKMKVPNTYRLTKKEETDASIRNPA